jgi:hypothetical protein
MRFFQFFNNILSGLYLSIKRFPATILLSASTAAALIAISELNPVENNLARIAMVLALGIPLSLCIKLYIERKGSKNLIKTAAGYFIGAIVLVLYHLFLLPEFEMVEITRYIAVNLALYLAFIFIPYLPRKSNFEQYVITLLSGLFITLIYSIVLFGGLAAILFAIDNLLGVAIQGEIYYYTWLFVVFLFALTYFLAGIPLSTEELSNKTYPKLLKILLLYIVMPLLSAYTIILYIYFAKIVATWQWPVNIVTHLVLWYSVIAVLVLFFITPLKTESSWSNKFLVLFPKLVLPLLIMMFISIYIRINAYGLTENRYFVAILGLWVLLIMGYFSFNKRPKNIMLPISLSILALISVFGPLSSYSLSKLSQNNRLELLLIKNNMINNGIQPSADVSKEDKSEVSSILDYFQRNHSLEDVKLLPKGFKMEDMNKVFGFSYESSNYDSPDNYFVFKRSDSGKAIDIQGYDYLFGRNMLYDGGKSTIDDLTVAYNYNSSSVKISYEGKEIYSKDFEAFIEQLIYKHGSGTKEGVLPAEELTITEENDKVKVKFIILSLSGMRDNTSGHLNSKEIDYYLLVKIK